MSFEDRRKREVETALLALFDAHSRVARLNTNRDSLDEREVEIETKHRAERKIAETAVDQVIDGIESLEEFYEYQVDTLSAECKANDSDVDRGGLSEPKTDHPSDRDDMIIHPIVPIPGVDEELSEGETDWVVDLEDEAEEEEDEVVELEDEVEAEADQILEEMEAEQEAEEDGRRGAEKEYDMPVEPGERQIQIVAALLTADDPLGANEAAEWIEENVGPIEGSDRINVASSGLSNAYSREYFPIERDSESTSDGRGWRYVYWIPSEDVEAVREAYSDEIEKMGISGVSPSDESETSESGAESDTEETEVETTIEHQSREHEVLALLTQLSDRDEEPKDPIGLALHGRRDVSEYSHVLTQLEDEGFVADVGEKMATYRPSPSGRDEINALGGFQVNATTTIAGP